MMSTYTANQLIAAAASGTDPGAATILDSTADILADLDALEPLATGGQIANIVLTDIGIAHMEVTPAQLSSDLAVLKEIRSFFTITIDGSAANITATGIAGIGTTVELPGASNQYTMIGLGDGSGFTVTDTGTGRTSTDHFSAITEVQFDNNGGVPAVAFAASETPIAPGAVPSTQIAALYAAVLARTPDSAGLAFYEAEAANPANTILRMATQFLSSTEYLGNPAHAYAQNATGDIQFITDCYENLLHRAPESGATAWYETNDVTPILAGLTPGTSAYATAEIAAHAMVLAHFSLSPEFVGDVSISAQNPAGAGRWLIAI
jgi:hypothetical protein